MKTLLAIFGVFFLIAALPLLGTLAGAFVGWVVGLFFEETVMGFFSRLGFDTAGYAMWQLGAALGFVSAFFRSTTTKES
jgi:hypothetical protein